MVSFIPRKGGQKRSVLVLRLKLCSTLTMIIMLYSFITLWRTEELPRTGKGKPGKAFDGDFCPGCPLLEPTDVSSIEDRVTTPVQSSVLLTLKGQKSGPNQDRGVLIEGNHKKIVALFDGHGVYGHDSADSAVKILPKLVQRTEMADADLRSAFKRADDLQPPNEGGCTAILVIQNNRQVTVASLGDSTAMVVERQHKTIVAQAIHHKPKDPEELARIEKAGGQVEIPPEETGLSSRVIFTTADGMEMGLAMSRCLGDKEGKDVGYLLAEPSILRIDLDAAEEYFLVVASDGVMDKLQVDELLTPLAQNLDDPESLESTCRKLMKQATENWHTEMNGMYRDDMTIVVTKLQFG